MPKKDKTSDNTPCKCGGRTALVSGQFYFDADQEPYKNGVIEPAKTQKGDEWIHALLCDKCNKLTKIWSD